MTNELDLMLDAALAEYGAAEPLAGLEERVLGRLQAEPARRPWWMWGGLAAAAAMLLMALLLMTRSTPENTPVLVNNAPHVASPTPVPVPAITATSLPKTHAPRAVAQVADSNLPKRDVFPSPTPPSEQELLLAKYMRVTPRTEVMAQIQREPLKFQEDPWAPSTPSPNTNEPMK